MIPTLPDQRGLPVDVLVTNAGNPGVRAAKDATTTLPIVMGQSGVDPVAAGFVASLARHGGHVTGLTAISGELSGKRLQLLQEALPRGSRVAVLWNAANPDKAGELHVMQAAAHALGVRLDSCGVRGPDAFEQTFDVATRRGTEALIVLHDILTLSQRPRIIAFAT